MVLDDDFDEILLPLRAEEFKRLFKHLSKQGNASIQVALAVMYTEGLVVPQDHKEATKWWWAAATGGHATAQYHLGLMYENGKRATDYKEAAMWYRLSAEQGNVKAQYHLGLMYELGWGVKKSKKKAVKQYRRAAEQGHCVAKVNLAQMYAGDQAGMPQNLVQALMWYLVSKGLSRESDRKMKDFIEKSKDNIEKKMSAEQIEESQCLAKEWMEIFATNHNLRHIN